MDTYPKRMYIVNDHTHVVRYVKFLFSNPLQIFKGRMVKKKITTIVENRINRISIFVKSVFKNFKIFV